jgi:predicted dehydrogenase
MTKRREFIKKSALSTAGIVVGGLGLSAKSYSSIVGANERLNIAIIGIRNQGSVHIESWCSLKDSHNVLIKTLCDTDELLFDSRIKMVSDKTGQRPQVEWDLYKVLSDKDIHAISIAMPNHWHALATILACQAGKHVYVEAARKYNVRVQCGLNNRSSENVREAIQFLHDGGIGELFAARALCFKARDSYGIARDSVPPATFHYDRWLGPAPWRPYNVKRSHYCWHWYWDTGNGDTGNTGPHQLDIARWGLNKNEHPVSVYSAGGLYGLYRDEKPQEDKTPGVLVYGDVETYGHDKTSQETPNTQTATFKYNDGTLLEFEVRGRFTNHEGSKGQEVGNLFFGSDGWLEIYGDTWNAFKGRERIPFASSKEGNNGQLAAHYANFAESIREGSNDILHCDINEGFYSSALPHLANISYRVGHQLRFMGENERFANDPEADLMLTREYRDPYIVPENV